MLQGQIHSFQSMGTVDGPGIRFVVFMQGCPLKCSYCHNPDTWNPNAGDQYSPQEVIGKALRYKPYFGEEGGITVSGGEPLLQAKFLIELFTLAKKNGIHTCLDTSGCIQNSDVDRLLTLTDLCLLDLKMTTEKDYKEHIGGSLQTTLDFLKKLQAKGIDTWIRQVIVEGINDGVENIIRMNSLIEGNSCIRKVELLPFKKLCLEKYSELNIPFKLENHNETTIQTITHLTSLIAFRE